ncbi:MAG: YhjD/YihY/BrkB family envelope integrity protein [Mycobacteriaceae bacterium]
MSEEADSGIGALVQRVIRWLDQYQQRHAFVGFCYAVIKKYGDDAGGKQAALITYYGFLSIFPILLLAVVTVTNVLAGNPALRSRAIDSIVPAEFRATVDGALTSLPTGGLPLAIGLVGLFLSGTGVVFSTQDALNQLAAVPYRSRFGWFPRYLRGIAMLAVLLVSVLSIGSLAIVSAELPDVGQIPRIAGAAGLLVVCFTMLLVAAKLLIASSTPLGALWPAAAAGALVVTTVLLVLGPLLTRFVTRSGPVYGSFATIVGLFALLYLVTQALVYSGEVAVVRHARLWPRAMDSAHPTAADERALIRLARIELRTPPQRITVSFDPDPE